MSPRFDAVVHHRARIGFVLILNEQTIEHERLYRLPADVGGFFARASMPREISTDNLSQVRDTLATADAVLLSCGALRSIEVVDRPEQRLAKPVICSNQTMLWDVLRLAGLDDRLPGLGRLLRDHERTGC